jgi:peptidoglycan LD-endopeptidase CwlK
VPHFGRDSLVVRAQLDSRLIQIADAAIGTIDFSLVCGYRGEKEQNEAFNARPQRSKTPWPKSKHNNIPSLAFDFLPYPFKGTKDWDDYARFARVFGHIESAAKRLAIPIRWGGDFNQDGKSNDDGWDWGHVELVIK